MLVITNLVNYYKSLYYAPKNPILMKILSLIKVINRINSHLFNCLVS